MDEQQSNTSSGKTGSADVNKRSFVKQASILAGVTTLAPTSVWGACNASGISGGSKENIGDICRMPTPLGGRSPGTWEDFVDPSPGGNEMKRPSNFLTDVHQNDDITLSNGDVMNKANYYYYRIRDFIQSTIVTMTTRDTQNDSVIVTAELSLWDAISAGSAAGGAFNNHAACAYVNLQLGLTSLPTEFSANFDSGIKLYFDHIFGAYINIGSQVESDISTYNDPSISEAVLQSNLVRLGYI